MTDADRARRRRERERAGLSVLRVEVDAEQLFDALARWGFISADAGDDAETLARGLEALVRLAVTRDWPPVD